MSWWWAVRGDTAVVPPSLRVTQQFIEVIGSVDRAPPALRVTQQFIEVLRSIDAVAPVVPSGAGTPLLPLLGAG